MKDLFSHDSELYQQARPSYPKHVVQEVLKYVQEQHFAWDCGAGSGQFTQLLAPYFEHIVATDLSEKQLQSAPYFENVSYQVQVAEQTTFANQSFDLITVAQAIHWFDFERFYAEVYRTLKADGLFAVVGYGLIQVYDEQINEIVQKLYKQKLAGFWDEERRYIDEEYKTIPFPFKELSVAELSMNYHWTTKQLLQYLSTWSAVKHYQKQKSTDALAEVSSYLTDMDQVLEIKFPIFLRLGKLDRVYKKSLMEKKSKY